MKGKLITFEGVDGCGKTTQTRLLANRLRRAGCQVVETQEPGGTIFGKELKRLILSQDCGRIADKAELLLFFAARAQHHVEVLQPILASGAILICDRFIDTTVAYQGHGRGLDLPTIKLLHSFTTGNLIPDLTFFLDIQPAEGLCRCREPDRIEVEGKAFWYQVYHGFLLRASCYPDRIKRIDADRNANEIAQEVWEKASEFLNLHK